MLFSLNIVKQNEGFLHFEMEEVRRVIPVLQGH